MSQAKVDKYKEEKKNREKIMKKEKMLFRMEIAGAAVVCLLILGWIGYSVADKIASSEDAKQEVIEFDVNGIQEYLNEISQ